VAMVSHSICSVVVVTLTVMSVSLSAQADRSTDPRSKGKWMPPARVPAGFFWHASDGPFTLDDLARRLAPTVWFSPDEPLLGMKIPAALPGDSDEATVYYSFMDVRRSGRTDLFHLDPHCKWSFNKEEGHENAQLLKSLIIRYFFYYPHDIGVFGHIHDLESFQIEIEHITGERGQTEESGLRVKSMVGSAHGLGWYNNALELNYDEHPKKSRFREDDHVVLPPYVLVEEGKHASSPDRNGDGVYTPGYDVTHYPRDAWGIRDSLAGKYLPGSAFAAHMAKKRTARTQRVLGAAEGSLAANEYRLRFGAASAACVNGTPVSTVGVKLGGYMRKMRICSTDTAEQEPSVLMTLGNLGTRPYGKGAELIGLNFRLEGGSKQVAFAFGAYRIPKLDGWLTPRISFPLSGGVEQNGLKRDFLGVDGLYTLSASRLHDWYVSSGIERWANDDLSRKEWRSATEVGWKLRFRLGDAVPVLAGVRIGVRVNNYRTPLSTARLVVEFGLGAW